MRSVHFIRRSLLLWLLLVMGSVTAWAQSRQVSGTVTSFSEGESLPGVAVRVKGTATGTITDLDGNYQIQVSTNDAVLQFSFIGYTTEEETVGSRTQINVSLVEDIETMSEVVVVGYGTQEKREVTGSIAKVEGSKISSLPTPSFEGALQGQAAGVQVIQGSGLAGSGSVIKIRGTSAISASGDPLYVVDGVQITQDYFSNGNRGAMNQNPLASLNPEDIESVEVLKDAGAAAIYGSRGANGVIIITTKRGKEGKGKVNFSTEQGFSEAAVRPKFLNTAEYVQLRQEAWENDGNTGPVWLPGLSGPTSTQDERAQAIENALGTNTDWWDETTRTGYLQEYNLSYQKGTEKLGAYTGISYSNNQSFLAGNSYERFSGRLNLDAQLAKNVKATLSSSLSRGINNRVDAAWSGGLGQAMSTALPYYPVFNDDGTYFTKGSNPARARDLLDWRTRELRSINGLTITYSPIKNLNVRAVGGYDYMDSNEDIFNPSTLNLTENNTGNRYKVWAENYTVSLQADYLLQLDQSKLTFLAGTEYQDKTNNSRDYSVTGLEKPVYEFGDYTEAGLNQTGSNTNIIRFFSYFGRATYNLKDKYILQGIARADASSTFGPENQYGFFPSVSAAWIMSEEDFLSNVGALSLLKLRGSYGLIGTAPNATNTYRGTWQVEGNQQYQGNDVIFPERLPNPDLKWQTTYNTDLGLEFGLFDNRISGELAYYYRLTKDVLIDRANPPSTGFPSYFDNIGEILNTGLELDFKSRNLTGDFSWTTNFNIAHNTNEVISLGDLTPDAVGGGTNDTRVAVGHPVGANYLVRFHGVDPADGLPIWLDREGYQTKEFSLDHRVIVGNVLPDFTGGLTNSFAYKGFDLSFLFTFTKGGNLYDASAKRQLGKVTDWNMRSEIGNRWTHPGDTDATFPRLSMQNYPGLPDEWQYNNTLFLYDASFVRLRNLSIGYNLPNSVLGRIRASNARVSLSAMNLLTFTKYPGDPEIARDFENVQDRNMSPNVTYLTTPQQRSFTLGINVTF